MAINWAEYFKVLYIPINNITICQNTNATGEISIFYWPFSGNYFIYFSWEQALFNYLLCTLKLAVHSKVLNINSLDQLAQGISFQNIDMRDDINWLRAIEYLPKDLKHRFTILTAVKSLHESTYLRFLIAFQIQVWVWLIITVFSLSMLWSIYQKQKLDKISSLLDIVAPLFNNEFYRVKKLGDVLNKSKSTIQNYGLLFWLSIWLIMSWILSECFSGQIITNLYTIKVYPVVDIIEDLLQKSNILIMTMLNENNVYWFKETKPDIFESLRQRIKMDNEKLLKFRYEKLDGEFWANGISEGKYVFFDYEGHTQNMRHKYSGRYPNLYISDSKYYYDPRALTVGRKHQHFKVILALFRIAFENGLYIHQKLQTDMIFLGTFDTAAENKKFSLELEDKTLKLDIVLRGPLLILILFLPVAFITFLCELCIGLRKIEIKSKVRLN